MTDRLLITTGLGICLLASGCSPSGLGGGAATGDVLLSPGADVVPETGEVTGTREGDVCDGWFSDEPQHVLTVESSAGATLRATSEQGARLWVLCGESNFCGEEIGDRSEVSRFWTRGNCDVYIGTANEGDTITYTFEIVDN